MPVISGNVSLFNESARTGRLPYAGGRRMLGLLEDASKAVGAGFPVEGLAVMLLGHGLGIASSQDMAGSEYLSVMHGLTAGQPHIDLELERRVQETCREGVKQGLVLSAHDCSDGGLAVALAECCILGGVGFRFQGTLDGLSRWDAALFGERQSRVVVAVHRERMHLLEDLAKATGAPVSLLGYTGGDSLQIASRNEDGTDTGDGVDVPVSRLAGIWTQSLEAASA